VSTDTAASAESHAGDSLALTRNDALTDRRNFAVGLGIRAAVVVPSALQLQPARSFRGREPGPRLDAHAGRRAEANGRSGPPPIVHGQGVLATTTSSMFHEPTSTPDDISKPKRTRMPAFRY
jgi:hypothetical protein